MKKGRKIITNFYLLGLTLAILAAVRESFAWYLASHDWTTLLSLRGKLALMFMIALFLSGLLIGYMRLLFPNAIRRVSRILPRWRWLEWALIVASLFVYVWLLLYSPWAVDFPGPWTRFVLAIALTCWILLVLVQAHNEYGWREIVLSFALFLYVSSVGEIRNYYLTELASRLSLLLEGLIVIGVIYLEDSTYFVALGQRLCVWRSSLGHWRWTVLALPLIVMVCLRFLVDPKVYWANTSARFVLVALMALACAFILTMDRKRVFSSEAGLLSLGAVLIIVAIVNDTYVASNYPFSLTWSEGNRFYDYSMIFGQKIYDTTWPIVNPYTYNAPGRFVLWGLPFLFNGFPIWIHRLWGSILLIAPPALFAWLVCREIGNSFLRYALALWISLFFIVLTPVYAPILFSAILLLFTMFEAGFWKRTVLVIIASVYASLSRWTWFLAPAAWAVIADLFLFYPTRQQSLIRKILPTAMLGMAGLVAGFLVGHRNLSSYGASESLTASQPLLWYRLFPNQTYSLGIVFGTLIITGPLLVILGWWMASRRWKLDWLQMLAVWGVLTGFLGTGLVVSTKIGGGGDLHNLDMYLITLLFAFAFGFFCLWKEENIQLSLWPFWIQALLGWSIVMTIYPFTPFAGLSAPATLGLPPSAEVQQTLQIIRAQVGQASQTGQVLFMDQRQLLTFGYIRDVPLVSDYEKKYMMDQSLASNANYFHQYYVDLSNKRFALIVSEPLKHIIKNQDSGPFSDENDAWVKWVSDPTLCFYKPIFTDTDNRVQLLIPRLGATNCGQYLNGR